jgi:outer membrane protein assembly factor BamA
MSRLSLKVASALALFVCLAGPAPARQGPPPEPPAAQECEYRRGAFHLIEGKPVGRVEFLGNTYTADNLIRRKLLLEEAQPFKVSLLRRSLEGMNRLGLFEKVTEEHVEWCVNEKWERVDFVIEFREKPSKRRRTR